jgi:PPOX class probable F420-dependent enzyme
VCFVLIDDVLWSPLDEKPKSVDDVRSLARIRDIERDGRVTLLVDRWSEDWSDLAWVRIGGGAAVVEAEPAAVDALRAKYRQYADHDLASRPMVRIEIVAVRSWVSSPAEVDATGRSIE